MAAHNTTITIYDNFDRVGIRNVLGSSGRHNRPYFGFGILHDLEQRSDLF